MVLPLGDDLPIKTSEAGYKTSETPYRWDVSPFRAMLAIAGLTYEGAKTHGPDNWRKGSSLEHLDKLLTHVFAYMSGDRSEDHLLHAAWRAAAAYEIDITKGPPETGGP